MNERGTYRPVYTALWDDFDHQNLSSDAILVFQCLRTSRLTNMACISIFDEGEKVTLAKMTHLTLKRVTAALKELSDTHWIAHREGIVWLTNGLKFDPNISLTNEKHVRGIDIILKSLPKVEIIHKFCDYYGLRYPFDTPSIPLRSNDTDTEPEHDTENDTETERPAKPDDTVLPTESIVKQILELYHAGCPSLPKIRKCEKGKPLYQQIVRVLKEHPTLDWWKEHFERVNQSDWLSGRNEKGFKADLHWILGPENLEKIINGRYDNRQPYKDGSKNGNTAKFVGGKTFTEQIGEMFGRTVGKPV
jgi:hypothetical protein